MIAFSPAAGLGAKWRNPVTGAGQSDRAHKRIVEEIKAREAAEENRLLYVAMTRAKNRLILSYAEKRRLSGWPKLVARRHRADEYRESGDPTRSGRVARRSPARRS